MSVVVERVTILLIMVEHYYCMWYGCCGNLSAQHVITVNPTSSSTVTLPAGLPATLDCASADSYSTSDNATYTNSESGTCDQWNIESYSNEFF